MADEPTKRKRGRPSASHASKAAAAPPEPDHDVPLDGAESRPRKRGRPSKDNSHHQTHDTEVANRKRGRGGENEGEEEVSSVTKKAKATRTRKTNQEPTSVEAAADATHVQPRAGRSALREKSASEAQRKAPTSRPSQDKPRRGRPSAAAAAADPPPAKQKQKKRGRPSKDGGGESIPPPQLTADADDDDNEEADAEQPSTSTTQGGGGSEGREKQGVVLPPKRYLHVAPLVRGVKQATIDAKWTPLTAPSIAVASEILELAHRPIIQRMSGTTRRHQHASAALSVAYRRITRKLQRGLPFPPSGMPSSSAGSSNGVGTRGGGGDGGRETELDFESVLDGRRALERQLDPALHAVELLQREKAVMVRELERDYMTLRNLEAGARTQAREQREKLKRAHVLAPDASGPPYLEEVEMIPNDNYGAGDGSVLRGNVFKDLENGELKDLALQLSGHMESIKTNLKQADGLIPQLRSTESALRLVLNQHLSQNSAERAVLG